ncbi:ADP-ribose pyrophosphatase YjhB, NUDIX family [Halogranum rubrum]|uniref:ADP-ribose pyrophosphatase YjhB, NUDIX family n=1 Tax=Halogranum rubrum TaxID=553466 RepID=A0A1I4G0F7_9EURY|nr:NUDIX hydrolase N-terminal domain-containing protein [Halogranum rubrum]SFL23632.1 ADP-ribose pyrophosphatase YjhB, NUDIX family [Halogranum rubrum]
MSDDPQPSALAFLDELRVIAQNGLEYAENPYDRERYDRLLTLTSEGYGDLLDLPTESVRERLAADVGHATAKVGGGAAVFDDAGRVLLVERADDGTWGLPCGYVEPNESPAETAVRETREETGLDVESVELVDVYHRPPGHLGPHSLVSVRYLCERRGGELTTSHETTDVQYWHLDEVPVWHKDHEAAARDAEAVWRDRRET